MGGEAGLWVRRHARQLGKRERLVMYTAGLSCLDATGFLSYSMLRLADECGLSDRSTQAAVRILSKLEYLVQGEAGFRLARYVRDRNGGKTFRDRDAESARSGGKIFRAQEEVIPRDSEDSRDTQGFSLSSEFSNSRGSPVRKEASERAIDGEMLRRIWAGIAVQLRRDLGERSREAQYLQNLTLDSVNSRELVVVYDGYLSEESIPILRETIYLAAEISGHRRGRQIRLIVKAPRMEAFP